MIEGSPGPRIASCHSVTTRTLAPARCAALLVALMGSACGDAMAPDERLAERVQPIVNGTDDTGDLAVVAMTVGGQVFCTGTLIRPTVVLTAAHCLPPNLSAFGISSFSQIEVFFGSQVGSGEFIQVASGWTHPGWNIDVIEDDIGLVRLVAAGPATPIPFSTSTMTSATIGTPTRLVGFGITSEGGMDSGRKRQGNSSVAEVFQFAFTMGLDPSVTCSGDSGGPTLMWQNGQDTVAGIHSRSDCVAQSIDTRVDDYVAEINTFIGETPPPPQCFADGLCATGCEAVDPDCPCAQDGFCSAECPDPSTDPDCLPSCIVDEICDSTCVETPDPDCESTESPVQEEESDGGWFAGDADETDYAGNIVSACAFERPKRGTWPRPALAILGTAFVFVRRRRR